MSVSCLGPLRPDSRGKFEAPELCMYPSRDTHGGTLESTRRLIRSRMWRFQTHPKTSHPTRPPAGQWARPEDNNRSPPWLVVNGLPLALSCERAAARLDACGAVCAAHGVMIS
jgi:hypothetical protein